MTSIQRISLSLLITIVLITGFAFIAYSGFFEYIEATFYNQRVTELYTSDLQKKKSAIEQYHQNYIQRFEAVLSEVDVPKIFSPNWDREYIFKHNNLFDTLHSEYQGLLFVRFIDENNKIHYSTREDDIERRGDFRIVYRILDSTQSTVPLEDLKIDPDKKNELYLDPDSNRFIYKYSLIDDLGQFRGTALFYVDKATLEQYLVSQGVLQIGREVSLLKNGYLFYTRQLQSDTIFTQTDRRWSSNLIEEKFILKEESTGESFILLSEATEKYGTVGILVNQRAFQMSPPLKVILLIASGLTVFLILLLVFSLRQDREIIIRNRLKKFQLQFLQGYLENQDRLDWNKIKSEIKRKKTALRGEMKKGLGKIKPEKEEKIDQLIDEGWQEIFEILDKRSAAQPVSALSIENIEEVIQKIYALQQSIPQQAPGTVSPPKQTTPAQPKVEEPLETEKTEATSAAPTAPDEIESETELEPAEEIEELEEVEEIEAVEELEEVEAAAAEELEEAEEIPEVEEVEEAEAIEEAEELEEAEVPEELTEIEVEPAPAAELEEVEEVEEVEAEEVEELEEIESAEEAAPVAAAIPAEIETELEPAEEIEELEEIEEVEAVEELEESEQAPAEDLEEAEEVEEVLELEAEPAPAAELEEVEEVEEVEAEEVEEPEEIESATEAASVVVTASIEEEYQKIGKIEEAVAQEAAELSETTISTAFEEEQEELEELEELEEVVESPLELKAGEETAGAKEKLPEAEKEAIAVDAQIEHSAKYINFDMEEWGAFDEKQKMKAIEDIHVIGLRSQDYTAPLHIVSEGEEEAAEIEELEVVNENETEIQSMQSIAIGSRYTINTLQRDILYSQPVQGFLEVVEPVDDIEELEELSSEISDGAVHMKEQHPSEQGPEKKKKPTSKKKKKEIAAEEFDELEDVEELEEAEEALPSEEAEEVESPDTAEVVEEIEELEEIEEAEEAEELEELEEAEEAEELEEIEEAEEAEELEDIEEAEAVKESVPSGPLNSREPEEGLFIFSLADVFKQVEGELKESIVYQDGTYQVDEEIFENAPKKENGELKKLITSVLHDDQLSKPEDAEEDEDISIEEIIGFGEVELPFSLDEEKNKIPESTSRVFEGEYSLFTSTGFQLDAFLRRYRSGKIGILKALMKISQKTGALYAAILSRQDDKWFMYDSVGFDQDRKLDTIFTTDDDIYKKYLQTRQPVVLDLTKTDEHLRELISERDMEYIRSLVFMPAIFFEKESFLFLGMKTVVQDITGMVKDLAEM